MRPPETSEARPRRWPCWCAALLVLVLAASVRADDEEAPADPPEGEHPAPAVPAVDGEPLPHPPRPDADRRPEAGMVPGLVTPDRIWRSPPAAASFFDPGSGAIYYPGMGLVQLTILDGATGKPMVVYYAVPNRSGVRDPSYYRALLARAVVNAARQAQAETAAAQAPAQPAPQPPARLISRLAPMLGGHERVPLRFVVGEARLRQGKSTGAALAFEQSAADFGEDPTPLLARAIALTTQGDYSGAADSLRRGFEGLADWHSLHVDWPAVLGGEAMAQSVEDDLRRRVGRERTDEDAILMLGFYFFAARRDAMAVDVLRKAVDARDPLLGSLQAAAARRMRAAAEARRRRAEP